MSSPRLNSLLECSSLNINYKLPNLSTNKGSDNSIDSVPLWFEIAGRKTTRCNTETTGSGFLLPDKVYANEISMNQ